ncbi:interferon-induced guanylate-binding 2-like [Brachionus plicatilis]|uniref:Interferon-induced guanylate-binding 2-like n=1 Tax=Brachionus plicatilis TaxID=10195 RepID=A0A3M7T9S1_BRAPC|nr:interferon-induced guanylate-binding 2-like [Brachionus plicatilis]
MNTNKNKNVIQLIEQNKKGLLVINDEALEIIQNLNDQIGVIVTVGKKRLGKSFMLNRLIGIESQNGFEISHIDEPCTKGIYMSTKIIDHSNKNGEKMKLILLDTEGLESKEASKEWDHKIFVLSLLLSSYFVYNTNGTYTRDDLEKLSFVTQISKQIRKNSSTEMDMNDFPQLMWVCRDYKFEIKNENAGYCFVNSFKNIDGFYLPFPDLEHPNGLSSKKILLAIENYKWDDFSGEFYNEMNKLCQKIKENVQIKMFNEKKLKGKIYSEFIRKVVENLNDEKTILVVDMVDYLIKIESNRNLDEIEKKYSDKLNEKEWNSIRLECDKQHLITLLHYEVLVSNFEKQYSYLGINEPENSRCWKNYYGKNYESLKTHVKNKIDQDELKKKKDELERIKKNLPRPNTYNFFNFLERDLDVVPFRNADEDESVICELCGNTFKNKHGLAIHTGKMHKNRSYLNNVDCDSFTCDKCGRNFETQHGLAIHKGKMHKKY